MSNSFLNMQLDNKLDKVFFKNQCITPQALQVNIWDIFE